MTTTTSNTTTTTDPYKHQCQQLLANVFPRISCEAVNAVLETVDHQFPKAFDLLSEIQIPVEERTKSVPPFASTINVFLQSDRKHKFICIQDRKLLAQVEAITRRHEEEPSSCQKKERFEMKSSGNPYINQCQQLLESIFPRISDVAINAALDHVGYDFPGAFAILSEIQYPTVGNYIHAVHPIPPTIKLFLTKDRPHKRFIVRDFTLQDQLDAMLPPVEEEAKEEEDPSTVELECGCCYGDYPRQEMTECNADASHNVCKECVRRYVREQLDGNNSAKFKCIVNSECSCTYPDPVLDQVLSPCLKKRVDDLVFREEIKMAGLDHWICPKCAHLGTIDDTLPTVLCPECDVYYCVDCNQVEHGIKTCEEARREASLRDPVRRAHEAMTQAVKRHCPSCNREFMKADGCNKMTCRCGTKSCYLCSQKVRDYSHFCNCRENCRCGNECKLFTSTQGMELLDAQIGWSAGETVLQEAGMSPEEIERNLGPPPPRRRRRRDPVAARVARNVGNDEQPDVAAFERNWQQIFAEQQRVIAQQIEDIAHRRQVRVNDWAQLPQIFNPPQQAAAQNPIPAAREELPFGFGADYWQVQLARAREQRDRAREQRDRAREQRRHEQEQRAQARVQEEVQRARAREQRHLAQEQRAQARAQEEVQQFQAREFFAQEHRALEQLRRDLEEHTQQAQEERVRVYNNIFMTP